MMRDCNGANSDLNDTLEEPISDVKPIYKEIVIIGNGPSGITLSFLLNGYWPFYNRKAHPDPMLSSRLMECTHKSLLHQDLEFLAQGIEGRSKNPVSLLIDAMNHPGADMGLEWPSLLTWKKTNNSIDHVVLGRGEPGGAWQGIAENVLTISPGRWMALPNLEMKEHRSGRAPAPAVFRYYKEYVEKHGLAKNMVNNITVTHIQPISTAGKRRTRWRIFAHPTNNPNVPPIVYECRHLVLATGAADRAGCLGVPGESLPYVTHDLKGLQQRLQSNGPGGGGGLWTVSGGVLRSLGNLVAEWNAGGRRCKRRRSIGGSSDLELHNEKCDRRVEEKKRLLVVGAGLSAADAILMAKSNNCRVVHAFRGSTPRTSLPAVMYPEYHEVYRLMQSEIKHPDYEPLPGYQVREFHSDARVTLEDVQSSSGSVITVSANVAAVLIGSQPDLSFVPAKLRQLGVDKNKPIDCKANPISIDPFSYRCVRAPPGLYAIGPLVGDNFVRFLQGGAVAVAGHIFKESSVYYASLSI